MTDSEFLLEQSGAQERVCVICGEDADRYYGRQRFSLCALKSCEIALIEEIELELAMYEPIRKYNKSKKSEDEL